MKSRIWNGTKGKSSTCFNSLRRRAGQGHLISQLLEPSKSHIAIFFPYFFKTGGSLRLYSKSHHLLHDLCWGALFSRTAEGMISYWKQCRSFGGLALCVLITATRLYLYWAELERQWEKPERRARDDSCLFIAEKHLKKKKAINLPPWEALERSSSTKAWIPNNRPPSVFSIRAELRHRGGESRLSEEETTTVTEAAMTASQQHRPAVTILVEHHSALPPRLYNDKNLLFSLQ